MNKQLKTIAIATTVFVTLVACTTSPTGRSQVLLRSSAELDKMGATSFEEMKKEVPISTDKAVNEFVHCVADFITPNVSSKTFEGEWEVVVFDSEQVNAFALPGGKIGVYTGILNVTDDADQLAAIIGHEVGHVIAQHSNERLSNNTISTGVIIAAGAAASKDQRVVAVAAAAAATQLFFQLPYSRTHESEADIIGQELMAQSGFDPRASVKLWQNMAKLSDGAPPEFLSTHPSHTTRINKLSEHLTVSEPMYAQRNVNPNCPKPVIPEPKKQEKPKQSEKG
ncbi:M48 family peptidase [Thalassotalea sp. HSM 43]|uniref:M48 family metallopeptidase n=1 Tax=Thalassotalea sp. HSM 43 TaxID=2552945 RepID=UPI0010810486|nr:M48 family metallopeptidase [Thalassotalea sp. HSM 43]QBY02966.1 M48 family peptidase [Thalassotalea sp. HSM 43]